MKHDKTSSKNNNCICGNKCTSNFYDIQGKFGKDSDSKPHHCNNCVCDIP